MSATNDIAMAGTMPQRLLEVPVAGLVCCVFAFAVTSKLLDLDSPMTSGRLGISVVAIAAELICLTMLVFNRSRRLGMLLATGLFAAFGSATWARVLSGEGDCHCFGGLDVPILYIAILDISILSLCLLWLAATLRRRDTILSVVALMILGGAGLYVADLL